MSPVWNHPLNQIPKQLHTNRQKYDFAFCPMWMDLQKKKPKKCVTCAWANSWCWGIFSVLEWQMSVPLFFKQKLQVQDTVGYHEICRDICLKHFSFPETPEESENAQPYQNLSLSNSNKHNGKNLENTQPQQRRGPSWCTPKLSAVTCSPGSKITDEQLISLLFSPFWVHSHFRSIISTRLVTC